MVHLIKAMVFPAVMYGCESWTIKKSEHWRIDSLELKCWRRLLRASWTARRWNQSILKEISLEYSLEGLMLKLKFQYFDHLMWRTDSLEKTMMLGKLKAGGEGDDRGWDGWMASPTGWTWVWAGSRSWWWTWRPGCPWGLKKSDMTEPLNWTEAGHGLSSKEKISFNFMAALTICSDFGAQEDKVWHCFHGFPIYFPWSDGTGCHDLHFLNFECWASFFTLLFHFHQQVLQFFFTLCLKGGVICISEVIDIFPGNLDSSLCFIQPRVLPDVLCI